MADVAFIIYKNNEKIYNELINDLSNINVPQDLSFECVTVEGKDGYSSAYNLGMRESNARIKFYVNENVRILDPNWIMNVIKIFNNNPAIGMIGGSGCVSIPYDGIFIRNNRRAGRVYINNEEIVWSQIPSGAYEEVLLVDSGVFATQYDIEYENIDYRDSFFMGAIKAMDFRRINLLSVVIGGDKTAIKYLQNKFIINQNEVDLFKNEYLKKIAALDLRHCVCCDNIIADYHPLSLYYTFQSIKNKVKYDEPEMLNRRHYSCPVCYVADRDRAYALWMRKNLEHDRKINILDIAPNKGLSAFIKREFPNADYKTADLFMESVDYRLDVTDMDVIQSESIDFFICSHVLEHVYDDIKAMKEFLRILKPGSCGIMVVPIAIGQKTIDEDPDCTDVGERWRRFGQDDHIRKYSHDGFVKRLKEVGFIVEEYGKDAFSCEELYANALTDTMNVYIVRKRL